VTAIELVTGCLDNPEMITRIDLDDNLQAAGVNSGEIIKIALACEEQIGRALSDEELAAIVSLRGVAELLSGAGHVA
jgi:acyl carrier protein